MEVLVIDDDESALRAIHRILRDVDVFPRHWSVLPISDPLVGRSLLILEKRVRIAIVDLRMPGLDGETLIVQALERRPEMRGKIIVCSGMPLDQEAHHRLFVELGCLRLDKPFLFETLEHLLCQAMED